MTKKYRLLKAGAIKVEGRTLYRIKALRDIGDVAKAGERGGYIESEHNLSHDGDAWVGDNAQVFENAQVYDNAQVFGDAQVYGDAQIYGNARVYGNAWVFGRAWVLGDAQVFEDARVWGDAEVLDNAWVFGNAQVGGNAEVCENARVKSDSDIVWFSHVGSENGTLTVYRCADGVAVKRGCFNESIEHFLGAVEDKHEDSPIAHEYRLLIEVACSRLKQPMPLVE